MCAIHTYLSSSRWLWHSVEQVTCVGGDSESELPPDRPLNLECVRPLPPCAATAVDCAIGSRGRRPRRLDVTVVLVPRTRTRVGVSGRTTAGALQARWNLAAFRFRCIASHQENSRGGGSRSRVAITNRPPAGCTPRGAAFVSVKFQSRSR